ncbi:MAG TPA: transcriptional regulator GcvA [Burkholderiaceae bacterium]|nr:transcriptional regulator GcvA [Steroidobacteraceae bacterium]HQR57113.1 transcriptional regulator GcvA [Burkholderiaceae bacterium]
MPRSLPPLTALRTFEAAARLGSFTRAARELHVTPAAVSHQIRGLEEYLGVTLFRRTTRRLVLTEQAIGAAENLRDAFDRIGRGVDLLRSSGRSGTLSVSATPAFAARWLVGRLARFQRQHPRIQLNIKASPSPIDFDQDDVDVAVRIGRGGMEGVIAVPLFNEWIAPVASPAYLRQHPIRRPAEIAKTALLHDGSMRRAGRPQGWQEWFRAAGVPLADARHGTHFDDGQLALQAAAAGGGIALGRLVYAVDDLTAKRLRIVLPPVIRMDIAYYLLIPESRANLPTVSAFRNWMEGEAAAFRRSFAKIPGVGRGPGSAPA